MFHFHSCQLSIPEGSGDLTKKIPKGRTLHYRKTSVLIEQDIQDFLAYNLLSLLIRPYILGVDQNLPNEAILMILNLWRNFEKYPNLSLLITLIPTPDISLFYCMFGADLVYGDVIIH